MELYHIDAHDTARVDEYLTEVQVRVARAGQKGLSLIHIYAPLSGVF